MSLKLTDLLKLTYISLRGNPLRSGLTSLGVFMGVTAVSATLQVGNISAAVIEKQLAARDAPQVHVGPRWERNTSYQRLQRDDLRYLRERLIGAEALGSQRWFPYDGSVIHFDRTSQPDIRAVSPEFLNTSGRQMRSGQFFNQVDFDLYRPVAVIDNLVAEELFPEGDAVGKRIYIDNRPYIVRGVVESRVSSIEEQPTGEVFLTMSMWYALSGRRDIGYIQIRVDSLENLESLQQQAIALLEQRYPSSRFWAMNNIGDILEQKATLQTVSRSLLAVGGIALLVGGVGIANITIASVMERTTEIGLRLAIGAKPRDVMFQFILEATALSAIGGIAAIATVHVITVAVSNQFELPYEFDTHGASIALGSAFVVGVGAGFLPALHASRLNPVTALRS